MAIAYLDDSHLQFKFRNSQGRSLLDPMQCIEYLCPPQNSFVEILTPSMTASGSRAYGWSPHEWDVSL